MNFLKRLWKVLISLKLAVFVIASLAISLGIATVIESSEGTRTAQFFIYRAKWFYGLLTLLGVNIFCVAASRYPWKKKHIPFLLAHVGIMMLLTGSFLTYKYGLDGNVKIGEGEITSEVELDDQVLVFEKDQNVESVPVNWVPSATLFSATNYDRYFLRTADYIPDAEPLIQFDSAPNAKGDSAVSLRIVGAPMMGGAAPDFWLWTGDSSWASQKFGPAQFILHSKSHAWDATREEGEALVELNLISEHVLKFKATSPRGEVKIGSVDPTEKNVEINPGFRMPIRLQVKKAILHAVNNTRYVANNKKSAQPIPAIHLVGMDRTDLDTWLGIGDRVRYYANNGTPISVGFFQKRLVLPFGLRLDRFDLKYDPGTMNPASYQSHVQVVDRVLTSESESNALPKYTISMNEPLNQLGYTFYQASYIPDVPRPTVTVLSVNKDPGRKLKYWGSILIIIGCISLYARKNLERRKQTKGAIA